MSARSTFKDFILCDIRQTRTAWPRTKKMALLKISNWLCCLITRRLRNHRHSGSWNNASLFAKKMSYQEEWANEALLEIPFHVFSERGWLGAARNATRSNAYANRQTCFGQKRLLAWVAATMSRCHQRNICFTAKLFRHATRAQADTNRAIERIDGIRTRSLFVPHKINFRFRNIKFFFSFKSEFFFLCENLTVTWPKNY